jgi:hypothetical protein
MLRPLQREVQVSKTINEFKGKAGTIYIERADPNEIDENGREIEVWVENFSIIGLGHTELEALNDAWTHVGDMMALIAEARLKVIEAAATTASGG